MGGRLEASLVPQDLDDLGHDDFDHPGDDSPLDEEISSSDLDRKSPCPRPACGGDCSPFIRNVIQTELNKNFLPVRKNILGAIETKEAPFAQLGITITLFVARGTL